MAGRLICTVQTIRAIERGLGVQILAAAGKFEQEGEEEDILDETDHYS